MPAASGTLSTWKRRVHGDNVADLDLSEAGRQVYSHDLVALLEGVVLSDVVEAASADDSGPLHLHRGHHARQEATWVGDITGKGAFLVSAPLGHLEAQTSIAVASLRQFLGQDPLLD